MVKTTAPKDKAELEVEIQDEGSDDGKPKFEFKINNVVATVTLELEEKIDLNYVESKYDDAEYHPEKFPGLVMRLKDPKATVLIFSNGKLVITGMKKATEAEAVVKRVMDRAKKLKIKVKNPVIIIQNIVASGDLFVNIDLNLAAVVMEYAMYEPEVFPGLIYRMQEPKTVFLLFSTGKIVCTGAKSKEIVAEAVEKLAYQVIEYGVIRSDDDYEMDEFEDELSFL